MNNHGFRGMVVGLGNPGPEYQKTPHNLGFLVLDTFFARHPHIWRPVSSPIAKCELWRGDIAEDRWLAVKPLTYMNRSGDAVGSVSRWYKLEPEQILVVHDDLDLQPGTIRFKHGGGAAGHKGILSIASVLGTNDFPRLRLGIGRPAQGHDPAAYVLRKFPAHGESDLSDVLSRASQAIYTFCTKGLAASMQEYHSQPQNRHLFEQGLGL